MTIVDAPRIARTRTTSLELAIDTKGTLDVLMPLREYRIVGRRAAG